MTAMPQESFQELSFNGTTPISIFNLLMEEILNKNVLALINSVA